MDRLQERAAALAETKLAEPLPRRWRHVCAVAHKAEQLASIIPSRDGEILVAAAWLHDVGYAQDIGDTGLHALDGARWLRRLDFDDRLSALVAYHSCALFEAQERNLDAVLVAEFDQEDSSTADALWYADMTTGPDGQDLDVIERLAEVRSRYGPDHLVTRFWSRAEGTLLDAVRRTEILLAAQPM